jgi:hypothetical protein
MRRIRDDAGSADPTLETAANVLRHVPAITESSILKRKIRLAIPSAPARNAFYLRRPALLLSVLVASAAAARGLDAPRFRQVREQVSSWVHGPATHARALPANKRTAHEAESTAAPPSRSSVASVASPQVTTRAKVVASVAKRAAVRPAPVQLKPATVAAPGAGSAAPAASDPGTELMVAAMQARRAGDLGRAERLLTDYRSHYPGGALAEEALALAIETATLQGSSRASALGRAYLMRFPSGRYRAWVEQTLQTTR